MRRGRLSASVGAVLVVVATGCSGGGQPSAGPTSSPEVSTSPETSTSPEQSESASPEVGATGKSYTMGNLSFRAPEGFRVTERTDQVLTLVGPTDQRIAIGTQRSLRQEDLDVMAARPSSTFGDGVPERQPDREVGGVTVYHLSGEGAFGYGDQFGVDHGGYDTQINFVDPIGTPTERKKWIDSVLATFEWE